MYCCAVVMHNEILVAVHMVSADWSWLNVFQKTVLVWKEMSVNCFIKLECVFDLRFNRQQSLSTVGHCLSQWQFFFFYLALLPARKCVSSFCDWLPQTVQLGLVHYWRLSLFTLLPWTVRLKDLILSLTLYFDKCVQNAAYQHYSLPMSVSNATHSESLRDIHYEWGLLSYEGDTWSVPSRFIYNCTTLPGQRYVPGGGILLPLGARSVLWCRWSAFIIS